MKRNVIFAAAVVLALVTGCAHHNPQTAQAPNPPPNPDLFETVTQPPIRAESRFAAGLNSLPKARAIMARRLHYIASRSSRIPSTPRHFTAWALSALRRVIFTARLMPGTSTSP